MSYAMYLRKSRMDMEAEASGQGDTLKRHRVALTRHAKALRLSVTKIYEEVVSGDSIAARPQMQQLLADVEAGLWDGVLVMEIERLARGDTIDQGVVAQAFRDSSTKIITPIKTYDPENEMDEEYFEFGLFMSRREYKTINRRLQRGKIASMNEGKWAAWKVPYGYQREKLEREKGFILVPDPDTAPVVQNIFLWYTEGYPTETGRERIGSSKIADLLNGSGIKSPSGKLWENSLVRSILGNPVYCGMIRWKKRTGRKVVENGVQKRKFTIDRDATQYYQGRHEPLISKETFDLAEKLRRTSPHTTCPRKYDLKNPFSKLCVCGACGHAMWRHLYQGGVEQMICTYPQCPTMGSYLVEVERAVLEAMEDWLADFALEYQQQSVDTADETGALQASLASLQREITQLEEQESRAYDLVEQGVYTPELFVSRVKSLSSRRESLEQQRVEASQQLRRMTDLRRSHEELVPSIRKVIETYPLCSSAKEKNDLLRSVLEKIEYTKTEGGRYCPSNMRIVVYPRLFL